MQTCAYEHKHYIRPSECKGTFACDTGNDREQVVIRWKCSSGGRRGSWLYSGVKPSRNNRKIRNQTKSKRSTLEEYAFVV